MKKQENEYQEERDLTSEVSGSQEKSKVSKKKEFRIFLSAGNELWETRDWGKTWGYRKGIRLILRPTFYNKEWKEVLDYIASNYTRVWVYIESEYKDIVASGWVNVASLRWGDFKHAIHAILWLLEWSSGKPEDVEVFVRP